MASRQVDYNGVPMQGAEPFRCSRLAGEVIDAIGDKINGRKWGETMSVLAEVAAWIAGQLGAGIDAIADYVDEGYESLGVVPTVEAPREEVIPPAARDQHKRAGDSKAEKEANRAGG